MIRCVRLWTGPDESSHVQIGRLDMQPGRNGDLVSSSFAAASVTVEETASGGTLAWHTAPVRQLVVTLAGTLTRGRQTDPFPLNRVLWCSAARSERLRINGA